MFRVLRFRGLGFRGLGDWGLGFRVFRVLRFRVWGGLGFRVFRVLGFSVGSEFRVWRAWSLRLRM